MGMGRSLCRKSEIKYTILLSLLITTFIKGIDVLTLFIAQPQHIAQLLNDPFIRAKLFALAFLAIFTSILIYDLYH